MHKEILTKEQIKLLPLLKTFSKNFGLVGGTAIALQIGHRQSVDFDMFSGDKFGNLAILNKFRKSVGVDAVQINRLDEITFVSLGVRITFFRYIYGIEYSQKFDSIVNLPDLLTLAAMKAFVLGRRAKWKDYVDLYFIMRDFYGINEIIKKGNEIFGKEFNDKIFKTQLAYFQDINCEERVRFVPGFEVSDKEIKKKLVEFSLE